MAGVDSTTWQRGYLNRYNRLNTSSNTGNSIVNEGSNSWKNNNPSASYKYLINTGNTPRDYGYGQTYTPNGGGTIVGGGGGGGGGAPHTSTSKADETRNKYLEMLKEAYDGYKKSLADRLAQSLSMTDHDAMEGRERNNMNTKLAERKVKNIYGGQNNGAKDSSMSRVWSNWTNSGSDIERQRLNSRQTHQINYDQNVANNDLNYANALYNLYNTDRQFELQKYLASLG